MSRRFEMGSTLSTSRALLSVFSFEAFGSPDAATMDKASGHHQASHPKCFVQPITIAIEQGEGGHGRAGKPSSQSNPRDLSRKMGAPGAHPAQEIAIEGEVEAHQLGDRDVVASEIVGDCGPDPRKKIRVVEPMAIENGLSRACTFFAATQYIGPGY
jgi:hypothetical protein